MFQRCFLPVKSRGEKPPWIPSHCRTAVKGWSSVDGFCLKSDTFELWGDWQSETWLKIFGLPKLGEDCHPKSDIGVVEHVGLLSRW